jgi:hypothetical protein
MLIWRVYESAIAVSWRVGRDFRNRTQKLFRAPVLAGEQSSRPASDVSFLQISDGLSAVITDQPPVDEE